MKYDLITVAASKSPRLIQLTQQTIDSCRAEADVNVILVETFKETEYVGVDKLILWDKEFVYNACLNEGVKYRKGDIQILANNDIVFRPGWSEIGYIMEQNGILSASALSEDVRQAFFEEGYYIYEGYEIGFYFTGWCIFHHRDIWQKIDRLPEQYRFWYSDDAHAELLREKGIKHYVIGSARVEHIGSATFAALDRRTMIEYATKKTIHRDN